MESIWHAWKFIILSYFPSKKFPNFWYSYPLQSPFRSQACRISVRRQHFRRGVSGRTFLGKLQKRIILPYFSKDFKHPALHFRAFGRKANEWKSLMQIHSKYWFLKTIFEKVVALNRSFDDNIRFLQASRRFGGCSRAPCRRICLTIRIPNHCGIHKANGKLHITSFDVPESSISSL